MRQIEITFKDGSKIIYNSTEDDIQRIVTYIEEKYPSNCGYRIERKEGKTR